MKGSKTTERITAQKTSRAALLAARFAKRDHARGPALIAMLSLSAVCAFCAAPAVSAATGEGSYTVIEMVDARTHTVDIKGAFSNVNGEEGPAGASVFAVPCPNHSYLFVAHAELLPAGSTRTYRALLKMGKASLPRGVVCGRPLPATLGTSHFTMVAREVGRVQPSFRITGERLPNGNLDAAIGEFESSLCDERYRFTATFQVGSRRVVFTYPFVLSGETLHPNAIKCVRR